MHSRIFQISKAPIPTDDHICADDFDDHWFLNDVADYVVEDSSKELSITWLIERLGAADVHFDPLSISFTLNDDFHTKYFSHRFQKFHETIDKLRTSTMEDFCARSLGGLLYNLRSSYEDKYSFYVCLHPENELITLDEFLRFASMNTQYFIGGTLDYHM